MSVKRLGAVLRSKREQHSDATFGNLVPRCLHVAICVWGVVFLVLYHSFKANGVPIAADHYHSIGNMVGALLRNTQKQTHPITRTQMGMITLLAV